VGGRGHIIFPMSFYLSSSLLAKTLFRSPNLSAGVILFPLFLPSSGTCTFFSSGPEPPVDVPPRSRGADPARLGTDRVRSGLRFRGRSASLASSRRSHPSLPVCATSASLAFTAFDEQLLVLRFVPLWFERDVLVGVRLLRVGLGIRGYGLGVSRLG